MTRRVVGQDPVRRWGSLDHYGRPVAVSPQTLSADDRRRVAAWAADCAGHVLEVYESVVADDPRVRDAIEQARAFAVGDLAIDEAIRRRGGRAGAAAREAPDPAARAAAYAAEQAAACAHMGAHALGAAGYATKAAVLAARDEEDDDVVALQTRRQLVAMSESVADALAALPLLGENIAGPLGPGRLGSGHVGVSIRAIQAELRNRPDTA